MQLIKEKHRSVGKDISIKIPLAANANLNGLQQSINEYIERETGLSINAVTDGETFRFLRLNDKVFRFEFYDGVSYSTSLLDAGFTQNEIDTQANVVANSFYIMQIYDVINRENQTLLHNSYYNGTSLTGATTIYNIPIINEFSNVYIPESFLNENEDDVIEVYVSFLFYNAKTGKLQVFYNEDNESLTTENKIYHTITITGSTRMYEFNNSGIILSKELPNTDYQDIINESLNSFENQKPQFPDGNKFNEDGTYEEIT